MLFWSFANDTTSNKRSDVAIYKVSNSIRVDLLLMIAKSYNHDSFRIVMDKFVTVQHPLAMEGSISLLSTHSKSLGTKVRAMAKRRLR